jgi:hypothetical protein
MKIPGRTSVRHSSATVKSQDEAPRARMTTPGIDAILRPERRGKAQVGDLVNY